MHTVENPGEGLAQIFAQNPRGGLCFLDKIANGGSPISGFIAFLFKIFLKIYLGGGGPMLYPLPLSPPCVHL
jgi:hypothetical protein